MTSASPDALLGLRLDAAQAQLAEAGRACSVTETQARPSRAASPVWGEMRVVRVRNVPDASGVETLELLVAREMLRDERAPRP